MTLHLSRNKGNSRSRAPNIMVVFTDQQRWDTCGCYGQALPVTPNLDRMAACELVSLIDLPPTILAGAGVAAPPSMQGRALQAVTLGQAQNWPREVFIQITENHIGRALRTERWKYAVWVPSEQPMSGWARGDSTVYHEHHFYDLSNDPYERNDLVADPAYEAVRAELAATLRRRMIQAGEPEPVILPSAIPAGTNA